MKSMQSFSAYAIFGVILLIFSQSAIGAPTGTFTTIAQYVNGRPDSYYQTGDILSALVAGRCTTPAGEPARTFVLDAKILDANGAMLAFASDSDFGDADYAATPTVQFGGQTMPGTSTPTYTLIMTLSYYDIMANKVQIATDSRTYTEEP